MAHIYCGGGNPMATYSKQPSPLVGGLPLVWQPSHGSPAPSSVRIAASGQCFSGSGLRNAAASSAWRTGPSEDQRSWRSTRKVFMGSRGGGLGRGGGAVGLGWGGGAWGLGGGSSHFRLNKGPTRIQNGPCSFTWQHRTPKARDQCIHFP